MLASSAVSLQELGLSPLEGQTVQAPFANYWEETYLPAATQIVKLDQHAKSLIQLASRSVRLATERIMTAPRTDDTSHVVRPYRQCVPIDGVPRPRNERISSYVQWDETIGSLNTMKEGQTPMIRVATLLQQENVADGEPFTAVDPDAFKTPFKAFAAQRRRNDLSSQKPSGALLKSAELIHKAGWIEPNEVKQEQFFDAASEIYGYITDAPDVRPAVRHQAQRYLSDLVFHSLSQQIRQAHSRGDTAAALAAHDEIRHQIANAAAELYDRSAKVFSYKHQRPEADAVGTLFEDLVPLAVRHMNYEQGLHDREIRHAFSSEDKGVRGVVPRPGFDNVVQQFTDSTVHAVPVQLKYSSSGRSEPEDTCPDKNHGYLPGIAYVYENNLTPNQIQAATAEMSGISDCGYRTRSRKLAPLRRLGERISGLLEAS